MLACSANGSHATPLTRTVIGQCLQDQGTLRELSITLIEQLSTVTFYKRCKKLLNKSIIRIYTRSSKIHSQSF